MAEISTVARPYSRAVFEFAQSKNTFAEWSQTLGFLTAVVTDPGMQTLISNTTIKKDQLTKLMENISGKMLDKYGLNLIKVLMENRRLALLPEITLQFETLRAEAEGTIEAEIVSAFEVSKKQEADIAKALQARLGRKVSLKTTIDKDLIGGAIVKAGDLVIDGSALGRLGNLSNAMNV